MRWDEAVAAPKAAELREFWTERRVCVLSTVRPDGRPHSVAVGATVDFGTAVARVIASAASVKVANVRAAGRDGAPVTVTQVDGGRWSSVQGRAWVRDDPDSVADAERRYAQRYRVPRPNPQRVVIEIRVVAVLGRY
ncbi:MAG TPA: pyridoxamine 5'-phosphate oxidase family protein [Pseudonocardia sp.]